MDEDRTITKEEIQTAVIILSDRLPNDMQDVGANVEYLESTMEDDVLDYLVNNLPPHAIPGTLMGILLGLEIAQNRDDLNRLLRDL